MSIQPDHKALIFCATVAVLGLGVRVVRAATHSAATAAPAVQPALDAQMLAADSSAQAGRGGKGKRKPRGTKKRTASRAQLDSQAIARMPAAPMSPYPPVGPSTTQQGSGYIGGKLDLDVATAAQLATLHGVSHVMAKRIVADRMAHGPFVNQAGLRRVNGLRPTLLARLDSLVAYSGTIARPQPTDTIIPRAKRRSTRVPARAAPLY